MPNKYVDCDGHVMEKVDEMISYVGEPFKTTGHMNPRRMLPSLDRFHTPRLEERKPGTFDPNVGPEKWLQFLDKTGLEASVLFPTEGLAYGQVAFPPWAVAYARAYNDWLHAKYLKFSSRLKGIALIPLQDVPAAVTELRRAVKDLGMVGAMLPSNGLNPHLSAKHFWPVYEEAARLNCALAVHGGCYGDLGFNTYTVFPAMRALGMPVPLAIAATGMIVDGMFDALDRGIRYDVIYGAHVLQDANALHLVQACIEAGEQARVFPHVPLNITIVDGRWALVGARAEVRRGPEFVAMVVHDSPLLGGLARIFEALWRIAVPITGGTELNDVNAGPSLDAKRLLTYLSAGLTDESIAREFGVSERTIARRIGRLQEALGAQTRFQLGVQASRQGWL